MPTGTTRAEPTSPLYRIVRGAMHQHLEANEDGTLFPDWLEQCHDMPMSWHDIRHKIEEYTGIRPSEQTVINWARKLDIDVSRPKRKS